MTLWLHLKGHGVLSIITTEKMLSSELNVLYRQKYPL